MFIKPKKWNQISSKELLSILELIALNKVEK